MHNIKKSLVIFGIVLFFISFLSVVYGQQGAKETAEKNYEQAKKNFDADPNEENTIWYYYNGEPGKAKRVFEKILKSGNRAAFGYIAVEVDLNNSPF